MIILLVYYHSRAKTNITWLHILSLLGATTLLESWLTQQFLSWTCSVHFTSFIFFRSFLTSSFHRDLGLTTGLPVNVFHLCIFFTLLVSGILCMCPNQLNLWALTQFIMFRCFINSSNSMFDLILQLPLSFLVGPKMFLVFSSQTLRVSV